MSKLSILNFRKFHTKSTINSNVLSSQCLDFIEKLNNLCIDDYNNCMDLRKKNFDNKNYHYRDDTKHIRTKDWYIDNTPNDLNRRHVELTGPGNNAKMVINALNSNANGYMLDLEDSMSPSWDNVMNAHSNIMNAVRGDLKFQQKSMPDGKTNIKNYAINNEKKPSFFVRVRGLHIIEENVLDSNYQPIPATIFDIGMHLYNNGKLMSQEAAFIPGPYLYVPKLESYEDALFVNKVITEAQKILGLKEGTTKVTALIETFPAIFQVDEIIYGLKEHIVGLNCGRWDYLFSMIKCLGSDSVLPDRNLLTMDKSFLTQYVRQIVASCHKRGIHAIGGMSANIPTNDPEKNKEIAQKVINDKVGEFYNGCDGAWVAHPGLISDVRKVFEYKINDDNQIKQFPGNNEYITKESLTSFCNDSHFFTEKTLRNNINISLQYISAWLSGNGAVAINNLMEDLATAEISIHQIKQWYNNNIIINGNNTSFPIRQSLDKILDEEYEYMLNTNEVKYASDKFSIAKKVMLDYIYNDYHFLPQVANKYLQNINYFEGIQFGNDVLNKLRGPNSHLTGIELTKHRGKYLNRFFIKNNNRAYKFLGTSNGISAVNVVAGGKGVVGPYAGGWQTNAMKNRLGMLLPDTLHVSPEESANCAEEINNHLYKADCIQHVQKINNPEFKGNNNYYDIALLADMEQGWNTPEKTRISVKKAIENGINVIHIEDQGEKKRCGHLGDKELNTYEDYALILRSANLAVQELLGSEQATNQWVRFVARTDAYSAKRIVNSTHLYDAGHDENKYIDWKKGASPDGKYLYLRQGINQETGRTWGMDLSIDRCIKVVDEGLASHVWMETPNADLATAKEFITNVNKELFKKGKRAYGLYNHSPSFDWDVKFFDDAKPFAQNILDHYYGNHSWITEKIIKEAVVRHGDKLKGDHLFTDDTIKKLLDCCLSGDNKIDKISEIIVDQRLTNFGDMLTSYGFNMHLITLPEFHVTAYNMHKLSSNFVENGINAFVKDIQRPERILSEQDPTYTYYKHQTASGTGVEAAFSEAVGSSNVNVLSDSTESDDIKNRNI